MSNTPFKITNIGSDTLQIAVEKIREPNQNTFFYKKSINTEWIEYENKLLAKQEERKRLKLEKKKASRV